MQELGAMAFDVLYSKISTGKADLDSVLPVQLIVRESCGCAGRTAPTTQAATAAQDGR